MKFFFFILPFLIVSETSLSAQTYLSSILCNETLTLAGSPYVADTTVIVPKGCSLTIEPGVEIRMTGKSYLIIKGKAEFSGTASQPVLIHAKDTSWGILYFDSAVQQSTLNYVIIEDATKGTYGTSNSDSSYQQAAISAYNSAVEINHCIFKNSHMCLYSNLCNSILIRNCIFDSTNTGEKMNLRRSDNAVIDSCIFYFTPGYSDAIDIDGCDDIIISNNRIYGGEDDAIDIGMSLQSSSSLNVVIRGNYIYHMADKGISCGELSTVFIDHNVIVGCGKGISVKSGCEATAHHNTLYANRVGIASYNKGDGLGGGNLTVTNSIIAASDTTWFADSVSTLSVTWSISDMDLIPGTGNILADPMFVSASDDSLADFNLAWGSPAIDSGDPAFAQDADGTTTDMGAFYYSQDLAIPLYGDFVKKVILFPNPAKQYFTLVISSEMPAPDSPAREELSFIISDLSGNTISESKNSSYRVDTSPLSPGVYFIEINSEKRKLLAEKLVIQH